MNPREYDSLLCRLVLLEKLVGVRRFFPCYGREAKSTDIVRFSLAYKRVVLAKILFLRGVGISVRFKLLLRVRAGKKKVQ
jgi:hypothetical protein